MATKPIFGRESDQPPEPPGAAPEPVIRERDPIDLGALAKVFALFGILSLVTSAIFLSERAVIVNQPLMPAPVKPVQQALPAQPNALNQTSQSTELQEQLDPNDPDSKYPVRDYAEVGPFRINKAGIVLTVDLQARLPDQSWTFVEAELLDDDKDYLFSFGNELWRESGTDSDGAWSESDERFNMKLTIPNPGLYYLNIKTQGTVTPQPIHIRVVSRLGSSIPHFAFGVITLLIGFALNEYKNRTALRLIARMTDR